MLQRERQFLEVVNEQLAETPGASTRGREVFPKPRKALERMDAPRERYHNRPQAKLVDSDFLRLVTLRE